MKNVQDIYELSPLQHGMLSDGVTAGLTGLHLQQLAHSFRGDFDVALFESAWQRAVERHPILRSSFHFENVKKPLQVVHEKIEFQVPLHDWTDRTTDQQELDFQAFLTEDREQGVNFKKAPLTRITLFRMGPQDYRFLWSFHHILIEGWSASLILGEVLEDYQAARTGGTATFPTRRPYREFITWIQEQDAVRAENYWREELAGYRRPMHLGIDQASPRLHSPVTRFEGHQVKLTVAQTQAVTGAARTHHVTLNTLIQGAWALTLARYAGQNDVAFGTMVSGRSISLKGVEDMVGLFVNTLPTRVQIDPERTTLDWLKDLQAKYARQREFEYLPLIDIKSWSEIPKGLPLFESLLILENWSGDLGSMGDLEITDSQVDPGAPGYPLAVVVVPFEEMTLTLVYDTSRFEDGDARRMLDHYHRTLLAIVEDPNRPVRELPFLGDDELQRQVVEWNDTAHEVSGRTVHQMFEEQAAANPEAMAVEAPAAVNPGVPAVGGPSGASTPADPSSALTYGALNARANRVARRLQELGVKGGDHIAICVERGPGLIVALLATLKAGATYVPFNPRDPDARLEFLADDAQPALLITEQALTGRFPEALARLILDADPAIDGQDDANLDLPVQGDDVAYMIYTSGSTGTPKGVLIRHSSLASYTEHAIREFNLTTDDRMLQFAAVHFDAAGEEIYPTLATGATLVLRTDAMTATVADFLNALREHRLSIVDLPTAYWHVVMDGIADEDWAVGDTLRLVILGGEAANPEKVQQWTEHFGESPRLLNTYGPTEGTIVATAMTMTAGAPTPGRGVAIGRPVSNTRTYVLDEQMRPVPVGVPGELYLGGAQVAVGYWRRPELTAERFVPDPFAKDDQARLYRTGDLVRQRDDGVLEFVGRIDDQVKFRGFRIELAGIDAILRQHDTVKECTTILRNPGTDEARLISYIVSSADPTPPPAALQQHLGRQLPTYSIPSAYVFLDQMPLTPQGKVDRDALPEPDQTGPAEDAPEPSTELEVMIADVWKEVLGVEKVGLYDNFFDLGGHSLLLMPMIAKLEKKLGVRIDPGHLVQATLNQLAAAYEEELRKQGEKSRGLLGKLLGAVKRKMS